MNEREESTRDPALSGLYRQAAPAEPPAALDAVILAAARQAVQPAPVRRTSWWKKWSTPLTVMATVVMAVMLTLTVDRQPKDLPAPASMPEEQAPAPVERREATLPKAAPSYKAEVPAAKADAAAAKAKSAGAVAPKPEPFPAAAPPSPAMKEKAEAPSQPAAELASPVMQEKKAARSALPPAAAPAANDAVSDRTAAPFGAAVPAARSQAEEARPELRKALPAASAGKPAMPTPQVWIEEIRQLRRQGQLDEASRRLAEFRKAYPDYVLPEDLR